MAKYHVTFSISPNSVTEETWTRDAQALYIQGSVTYRNSQGYALPSRPSDFDYDSLEMRVAKDGAVFLTIDDFQDFPIAIPLNPLDSALGAYTLSLFGKKVGSPSSPLGNSNTFTVTHVNYDTLYNVGITRTDSNSNKWTIDVFPDDSARQYISGFTVSYAVAGGGGSYTKNIPNTATFFVIKANANTYVSSFSFIDAATGASRSVTINSLIKEFPYDDPELPAPTGLTHSNVTSTSARVGWNSVSNASGYKVEYRQSGGGGVEYATRIMGRAC